MNAASAVELIRQCLTTDRVIVTDHFAERMAQRGLFWTDLLAVLVKPSGARTDGFDAGVRERWFVTGDAPDDLPIDVLCAIDATDPLTVLVTIDWES